MKKLLKLLDVVEQTISCVGFVIMFAVVTINVFSRYVLSKSFSWAEEISYICFIWSVFMGVCILYKKQGLICIDVLVNNLPKAVQRGIQIFTFAMLSVVNLLLIYYGYSLAAWAWIRPTASLRIPYFFIDMAPTTAFCILLLYSVRFLIMALRGEEISEKALEERS